MQARARDVLGAAVSALALAAAACAKVGGGPASGPGGGGGSSATGHGGNTGGLGATTGSGTGANPGDGLRDCINLECQQTTCNVATCIIPACGENESRNTTLSGTVYDPAGKVPLYNVVVYVPNAALDPIPEGVSCVQCDGTASGKPIASAITDASGHFVLKNPPVGNNIPLVLQVGKWRRQVTIPQVARCQDNPIDDHDLLRLPRTQAEGHMPLIAVSTGHSDALDCLLRKIGIADPEFTTDAGTGRVHMYVGGGGVIASDHGEGANQFTSGMMFPDAYQTLLNNDAKLANYDILVLQCEGQSPDLTKFPFVPNLRQYADTGGRVFAEHVHAVWISKGLPPWPASGNWIGSGPDLPSPSTGTVDTSFPKGQALSDWLMAVGASTTAGQIQLNAGQNSIDGVYTPTQSWISTTTPATTQYLTFNTPLEVAPANQCGRVVFTDVHVANGDSSHPETPFPMGCVTGADTTPQEKALEFMFFDLSSCIQEDRRPPEPPPVVP
jgi:hypothetical protein